MKPTPTPRKIVIEIISLLYVLLFVYAAVSKLLDFQNFRVQLGQSPLLSAFAEPIAVILPVLELVIAIALCIPKFRTRGLYMGFCLMVMFTCYIYMILHYSPFVPCSCGGVLENMDWQEHLLFNAVVTAMGAAALLLMSLNRKTVFRLSFGVVAALAVTVCCYLFSDSMIRKENPFVRRYTSIPFANTVETRLPNPNFYLAGASDDTVFLGSYESPLHILSLEGKLQKGTDHTLRLDREDYDFRSIQVRVDPPFFHVWDGMVPVVFRGRTDSWKAEVVYEGPEFFTKAQPMGDGRVAIRAQNPPKGEHLMAVLETGTSAGIIKRDGFLEKQLDGIFDTEGTLQYSRDKGIFVYTYYYRNQFIVADSLLRIRYRGHTIDTTTVADLDIVRIAKTGDTKLARPPLTVNKGTSVHRNLLFVHSGLMGRYETREVWEQASIVDVYDLITGEYVTSFYIYDAHLEKMRAFMATDRGMYTLSGSTLQLHYWSPSMAKLFR